MAFIKLLLILAALSFAEIKYTKDVLYISDPKLASYKDGVLTLDVAGIKKFDDEVTPKEKSFDDYKPLKKGTTVDDEKFSLVADTKAVFEGLATSKVLKGDDTKCKNAIGVHESFYGVLGYTIKAVTGDNIAPSITFLIKNGPTKIEYKNIEADADAEVKDAYANQTIVQTCDSDTADNALLYSLYYGGVTDAKCFPNTAVPTDVKKCTGEGKIKAYLKKYSFISTYNGDIKTIKNVLLRFGAVQADEDLVIGWETVANKTNWIIAEEDMSSPTTPTPERNEDEPQYEYKYVFKSIPASEESGYTYNGAFFGNGMSVVRAALSLIATVLVLPALLL